jgi:hypothetical protein
MEAPTKGETMTDETTYYEHDLGVPAKGVECPSCGSTAPVVLPNMDTKWIYDGKTLRLVDFLMYGGTAAVCADCGWRDDSARFDVWPEGHPFAKPPTNYNDAKEV